MSALARALYNIPTPGSIVERKFDPWPEWGPSEEAHTGTPPDQPRLRFAVGVAGVVHEASFIPILGRVFIGFHHILVGARPNWARLQLLGVKDDAHIFDD